MSIVLRNVNLAYWSMQILDFSSNGILVLEPVVIHGKIMNSVQNEQNGKVALIGWKRKIAKTIFDKRTRLWDPSLNYSISLGIRFFSRRLINKFDIENYVKPIYDAIAAGLFSTNDQSQLTRFNFNDSNFKKLLHLRLKDANFKEEGI